MTTPETKTGFPLMRAWLATLIFIGLGILAIISWMATFNPHNGREYSVILFPLARAVLMRIYWQESVPPAVWFGACFAQWVLIGLLIDGVRWAVRRVKKQ